jgi:hypothetical protein
MQRILGFAAVALLLAAAGWWVRLPARAVLAPVAAAPGAAIDSLNGVVVYNNGGFGAKHGRNVVDGYNVGLKYQCVEFVKRYYLERFDHRMPNSYGHAKDFFDSTVADGALNPARALRQFRNGSATKPAAEDLLVLGPWSGNPYGHVAIISRVGDGEVEVVQQNTGNTRNTYDLDLIDGHWRISSPRVLGWLRRAP